MINCLADIDKALGEIRSLKGDDESSHFHEDELYRDFIAFVRDHCQDPEIAGMASAVLESSHIKFYRWCA